MTKKQIHIRVPSETAETSEKLKNLALADENLTFFSIHTGTKNNWDAFVYQMGLMKIQADFNKFAKMQEDKDENNLQR